VSARVPEKVARGVFANSAFVIQGPTEFAIDFVLRMCKPHQIVARVFLPFHLVPQVIGTLKTSMDKHRQMHGGTPPSAPTPAPVLAPAAAPAAATTPGNPVPAPQAASPGPAQPPTTHAGPAVSVDELYEDLKMSEDVMGGVYANALLVVTNASEYCLDFIVNLYPRAVVSSRVFMSAAQVPILLTSLNQTWQKLQAKQQPPPQRPMP
jgi:Protein of unknown function (DUF3467)